MFPHRPLSVGSIYKKRSNNKHVRLSFSKIELLDQNTTDRLNQTELSEWAMKKFNLDQPLAQQTISNILKNAETLYSNINVVNNGKSIKTTRYPQIDEDLLPEWSIEFLKMKFHFFLDGSPNFLSELE
ncbi:hypothetical protein RO3G_01845 [Rhizopus delemar RA 99-880]|uniref:ARS-binding protein 1 N-terminal domain-containing protein n=1 Tax=Rhizopus delemar (strain RA 99-880 / ATCC MYA-4621 / FGSC 9543 / NRRL 43880) TaxID=246409 RepID=I1BLR1_RHIO9|nr:hypothetical protein RO3G_01845 [Rhizopus delemar RA 99-880]|eukprot:EIE77141.1 hypothetical protein RO3G_01845 [Rhizopus delemar RA 99-880]